MPTLKAFAEVLQEYHAAKRTGALYISVAEASENLIRFYFKEGEIYTLSYGPARDKECLDIIDCYDLGKAVFFDGMKATGAATNLPKTDEIIKIVKKSGKSVQVD